MEATRSRVDLGSFNPAGAIEEIGLKAGLKGKRRDDELNSVSNTAKKCFEFYSSNANVPAQKRHEQMKELSTNLKSYDTELQASKSIFTKIKNVFFGVSQGEKELKAIIKQTNEGVITAGKEARTIAASVSNQRAAVTHQMKVDSNPLSESYLKLYERDMKDVRDAHVSGLTQEAGLASYLNDLRSYDNKLPDGSGERTKIQNAIKTLEFTFDISILQAVARKTDDKLLKDEVQGRIKEELQTLRNSEPGATILLPGGYSTKEEEGHAILYELRKESNNPESYSFTVVNVGEGSKEGVGNLAVLAKDQKHLGKKEAYDVKYEKIPFESLEDSNFLKAVTSDSSFVEGKEAMKGVNEGFQTHFHKKGIYPTAGNVHKGQTIGNCGFESPKAWLQNHLASDYKKFRLHVVEKEIDKLENIYKTHKDAGVRNDAAEMKQILTDRKVEMLRPPARPSKENPSEALTSAGSGLLSVAGEIVGAVADTFAGAFSGAFSGWFSGE